MSVSAITCAKTEYLMAKSREVFGKTDKKGVL